MDDLCPVDKLHELCSLLEGQQLEVHRAGEDGEYAYLHGRSVCITVRNPCGGPPMFLDLTDEFTVTCGMFHGHYAPCLDEYSEFTQDILDFLNNELCAASLGYGPELKWLGSTSIPKEDVSKPLKEIFAFVFRCKEFRQKLQENGGTAQFRFWNPADDRTFSL